MSHLQCTNCRAPLPQAQPGSVVKCNYCGVEIRIPVPTMWRLLRQPVAPPPLQVPPTDLPPFEPFQLPPYSGARILAVVFVFVALGVTGFVVSLVLSTRREARTTERRADQAACAACEASCRARGMVMVGCAGSTVCSCRSESVTLPRSAGADASVAPAPVMTPEATTEACGTYVARSLACTQETAGGTELPPDVRQMMSEALGTACSSWADAAGGRLGAAIAGCGDAPCNGYDSCVANAVVEAAMANAGAASHP